MIIRADIRCLSTFACVLLLSCLVPAGAIAQFNPLAPPPGQTEAKPTTYYEGDGLTLSMKPVDGSDRAVRGRGKRRHQSQNQQPSGEPRECPQSGSWDLSRPDQPERRRRHQASV